MCVCVRQSDDSLEYLSVEERACLMFLESTIESLEMEEDSGLSNDEPDPSSLAAKHHHLSMGQTKLEGEYGIFPCRTQKNVSRF